MAEINQLLREKLFEVQVWQLTYAGGKDMTFKVGNTMRRSTWYFQTTRPSQKLDHKYIRAYTAGKIVNKNSYEPDLLKTMRNQSMVHVS